MDLGSIKNNRMGVARIVYCALITASAGATLPLMEIGEAINPLFRVALCVIAALVVLAIAVIVVRRCEKKDFWYGAILALIYSAMFVMGMNISRHGSLLLLEPRTWLELFVLAAPLSAVLSGAVCLLANLQRRESGCESKLPRFISRHRSLVCFVVIFIVWGVCFLAAFPGLYTYDAIYQTYDAIVLQTVNSFHPLIHTYWFSGCLLIGKTFFSSYDVGMAIYSLSQMGILAFIFARITVTLHDLHHSKPLSTLFLAFFALFPVNVILSFSSTKDVVFSGLLALLTLLALKASVNPDEFFSSRKRPIEFVFVAVLMAAFRNNGIYVLVAFAPFFVAAMRRNRRNTTVLCLTAVILAGVYCGPFTSLVSQSTSNAGEVLGVPMQQLSRVMTLNPDDLTDEERAEIESYIPSWENYVPGTVDPIKFSEGTNSIVSKDVSGFLKVWVREAIKYPTVYLDAAAFMTYGYWYPWANYQLMSTTKPYLEYCVWERQGDGSIARWMGTYLETMDEEMAGNAIVIQRHSLIPGLSDFLQSMCMDAPWSASPVIRPLFNPGTVFWLLVLAFALAIYRRQWRQAVPLLLLVFYIGTCLLGPVFLIRYAYPLFTCLPIIVTVLIGVDVGASRESDGTPR